MARCARWRASRWVGGAGLRGVAPRTLPSDFFDTRKNHPPRDSKKVARRGSGHRRLHIRLLFFLTAKRQPRSRSAQAPLHNSANAVMRMVMFLFQRAKR